MSLPTGMQVIIVTKYINIHNTVSLTFRQHAIDLFIEFIGKEVWLLFCMFAFEMRAFGGRERERERERETMCELGEIVLMNTNIEIETKREK